MGWGGTVMDTLPCFPCDNWRRLLQLKRVCSLCRGAILNVQIPWLWFIAQLEGETFTPRTLAWQHTKCVSIFIHLRRFPRELRPLLYINPKIYIWCLKKENQRKRCCKEEKKVPKMQFKLITSCRVHSAVTFSVRLLPANRAGTCWGAELNNLTCKF